MDNPELILIVGPTGSGKTSLVCNLSPSYFEVVSFDSRQIYRDLPIGTTAPTYEEKRLMPHHLTGIIDSIEGMDANRFRKMATSVVDDIRKKGKIPILTAGTGFYLSAFLNGMYFVPTISEDLKQYVLNLPDEKVVHQLNQLDPEALSNISNNDLYRCRRALEVGLSGVKWSSLGSETDGGYLKDRKLNSILGYFLDWNRDVLYKRINDRCKIILEGMVEEAWIVAKLYGEDCPGLKTLGYKLALDYKRGLISIESFYDEVTKAHRNYAKKQIAWFRKDKSLLHISWDLLLGELLNIESNKIN